MDVDKIIKRPREKLPHPEHPPRGTEYKCEECGLETIMTLSKLKKKYLKFTGKLEIPRDTNWHHLYEIGCLFHPKYATQPYYKWPANWEVRSFLYNPHGKSEWEKDVQRQIRPGVIMPFPRSPEHANYWLCEECFNRVIQEEKEAEEDFDKRVAEKKREREEEEEHWSKLYWENPDGCFKGIRKEIWKWFVRNEGKKVEIEKYEGYVNIDDDERERDRQEADKAYYELMKKHGNEPKINEKPFEEWIIKRVSDFELPLGCELNNKWIRDKFCSVRKNKVIIKWAYDIESDKSVTWIFRLI